MVCRLGQQSNHCKHVVFLGQEVSLGMEPTACKLQEGRSRPRQVGRGLAGLVRVRGVYWAGGGGSSGLEGVYKPVVQGDGPSEVAKEASPA